MTEYYREKLEEGLEFQDFVIDNIDIPIIVYASRKYQENNGESKCGIEIKHDMLFRKTGNLYIETAEKSNATNINFVQSGIYRKDNTWLWIIGDYKTVYFLAKEQLIALDKYVIDGKDVFHHVINETSMGFLLPIEYAIKKKYIFRVYNFPTL